MHKTILLRRISRVTNNYTLKIHKQLLDGFSSLFSPLIAACIPVQLNAFYLMQITFHTIQKWHFINRFMRTEWKGPK